MSEKPRKIITNDSGAMRSIGYEIHVFENHCETHLKITQGHRNRRGNLHGGLFSLVLDSACGYAASYSLARDSAPVVTVSLTTNFLGAAAGDEVRAVGRVTKKGRSMIFTNGEIFDENNNLIATGTAVFKAMP